MKTLVSMLLLGSVAVAAPTDSEINDFMNKFERGAIGTTASPLYRGFDFEESRQMTLHNLFGDDKISAFRSNDSFLDDKTTPIKNIFDMQGLHIGTPAKDVYAGSYWPLKYGRLAYQYRGGSRLTKRFYKNYRNRQVPPYYSSEKSRDRMAPSAKYDLLIGDTNFSLTKAEWAEAKWQNDNGRRVQSWEGYCHGFAMASVREKRPKNAVTVTGALGHKITFYPSDLKALSAGLWGSYMRHTPKAQYEIEFAQSGTNCASRDIPRFGSRAARSSSCNDTNPGIFHLALINIVGDQRDSFIMDKTANSEVWNHPITKYSLKYYKPNASSKTGTTNVKDAIVPVENLRDRFRGYRSPRTRYIVAVAAEVTYKKLISPSRMSTDANDEKNSYTRKYYYDLELDANHEVIGGEWYMAAHPDMIWRPKTTTYAMAPADETLGDFDLLNGIYPDGWLSDAKASSRKARPSGKIVRKLLELAQ